MKNKFTICIILLLLAFFHLKSYGQGSNDEFIKLLGRAMCYVEYLTDTSKVSGSGFFVMHLPDLKINAGQVFLITNKHVLPRGKKNGTLTLKFSIGDDSSPVMKTLNVPISDASGRFYDIVKLHPDNETDIALVDITGNMRSEDLGLLIRTISDQELASDNDIKKYDIHIASDILIYGYPDGIYDERNAFPIVRKGIISTPLIVGYSFNKKLQKKFNLPSYIDGFLIDAGVYPGSSGSVVITNPEYRPIKQNGALGIVRNRSLIIGIVAKSIPITDFNTPQRMGVGVVFSSQKITELLKLYYIERQLPY